MNKYFTIGPMMLTWPERLAIWIIGFAGGLLLGMALAHAQDVPNHALPIGRGPGVIGWGSVNCGALGSFTQSGASADPICTALAGTGVGAKIATATGTLTSGHCVSIDGSGDFIDAGGACTTGGGGGTVSAASQYNIGIYATAGTVISGLANGTAGLPLIEGTPPSWTALTNAGLASMPADTVKCNNTGSSAAPTDCTSLTLNLGSNFGAQTVSNFSNDAPAANIERIFDRLFVGAAAVSTAQKPPAVASDWLGAYENSIGSYPPIGTPGYGVIVAETNTSAYSQMGVVAGARTLNTTPVGGTALALVGIGLSDNSSLGSDNGAWGLYTECHREATGAGSICLASEFEPRNNATGELQPDPFTSAFTMGVGMGCGAGVASTGHPCGAMFLAHANPEPFNAGIVMFNGSLTTQTIFGQANVGEAIALPPLYSIIWYSAAGTPIAAITSDSSGNVDIVGTSLKFNGVTMTVP